MIEENYHRGFEEAVELLKQLIAIPSFSREEEASATLLEKFFSKKEIPAKRLRNNVWAFNRFHDPAKPTILLNSHHDTVRPVKNYTIDPFEPVVKDGKLFGLGSNDAGASLVSLIALFLFFYERKNLKYNLILAATAEEEISGAGGIESVLPLLGPVACAIVGEPTGMHLAVAEKGLLVLDCISHGKAGHAAREEGMNAIYHCLEDIEWIRNYQFEKDSELLGPTKMTVTSIETTNKAHNVIPGECSFLVDVRLNEKYSHEEVLNIIKDHIKAEVKPRSFRLRSSMIPVEHPLVEAGITLGRKIYGSPTTSDKALMPFPALKMGPGESERSHTADEFIFLEEIKEGIHIYTQLLNQLL